MLILFVLELLQCTIIQKLGGAEGGKTIKGPNVYEEKENGKASI